MCRLHRLPDVDDPRTFIVVEDVVLAKVRVHKVAVVVQRLDSSPHLGEALVEFFRRKFGFFELPCGPPVRADERHDQDVLVLDDHARALDLPTSLHPHQVGALLLGLNTNHK